MPFILASHDRLIPIASSLPFQPQHGANAGASENFRFLVGHHLSFGYTKEDTTQTFGMSKGIWRAQTGHVG
jgi:hypothetical protein